MTKTLSLRYADDVRALLNAVDAEIEHTTDYLRDGGEDPTEKAKLARLDRIRPDLLALLREPVAVDPIETLRHRCTRTDAHTIGECIDYTGPNTLVL